MKHLLWVFVVALLAIDITMLVQREQLERKSLALRRRSDTAMLKAKYAAEEENILNITGSVPATFPRIRTAGPTGEGVEFFLLASVKDCTNAVEDEVLRLNQILRRNSNRIAGVQGFFVDEDQPKIANRFIGNLSPPPAFPMAVKNVLPQLPAATTPLVLVVRLRDGRILDAHKPIPQDMKKRDAFYARWTAALGLS